MCARSISMRSSGRCTTRSNPYFGSRVMDLPASRCSCLATVRRPAAKSMSRPGFPAASAFRSPAEDLKPSWLDKLKGLVGRIVGRDTIDDAALQAIADKFEQQEAVAQTAARNTEKLQTNGSGLRTRSETCSSSLRPRSLNARWSRSVVVTRRIRLGLWSGGDPSVPTNTPCRQSARSTQEAQKRSSTAGNDRRIEIDVSAGQGGCAARSVQWSSLSKLLASRQDHCGSGLRAVTLSALKAWMTAISQVITASSSGVKRAAARS